MSAMAGALLFTLGLVLLSSDTSALPSGQRIRNQAGPEHQEVMVMICDGNTISCLSASNLTHSNGGCYSPLTQGPCPDGQWLVLDPNAATASALGKCVTLSCPPDSLSRECRRSMEAFARACPPLPTGDEQFAVHMNPLGQWSCGVPTGRVQSLHDYISCVEPVRHTSFAVRTHGHLCAQGDTGECSTFVVGSQPNITLETEN